MSSSSSKSSKSTQQQETLDQLFLNITETHHRVRRSPSPASPTGDPRATNAYYAGRFQLGREAEWVRRQDELRMPMFQSSFAKLLKPPPPPSTPAPPSPKPAPELIEIFSSPSPSPPPLKIRKKYTKEQEFIITHHEKAIEEYRRMAREFEDLADSYRADLRKWKRQWAAMYPPENIEEPSSSMPTKSATPPLVVDEYDRLLLEREQDKSS